ncbi:GNAT family N-acetyltransferase [Pseudoclavibacter helvolus]|uniref:GNAT family N-acetyltransferase n=1 Tax=Pseudoclavibacter helvolus TaxID=255205 RepID=UPI003C75A96C
MSASVPTLTHGPVSLRPIKVRDARELESVLLANREWLQPWEATSPGGGGRWDVRGGIRSLLSQASAQTALPFVITYEGRFAGQLTVSSISYGALSSATLGYWVAREFAGKGLATIATAMATDHCLQGLGLHRMEICIRPENAKSLRVVEKLGLRYEGLRRRYIHIDGDWRDHFCFGVVREEVPQGVLRRWREGAADERLAQVPEVDWQRTAQPFP